MSMSVGIGEETSLEHLVGRGLDSWNQMSGRKSDLLDLGKVVGRVAVENHSTDWYERVLAVRPHLSDVERVEFALLGLFDAHHLNVERPRREVSVGDRIVQVFERIVRILSCQLACSLCRQVLDALIGLLNSNTTYKILPNKKFVLSDTG